MKPKLYVDLWLFVPVTILITISLVTLFSVDASFFRTQLISLFVGLVAYFVFSKVNIEFLKQLAFPIYIVSIFLLFIVLIVGIESRGASRWLELFGVRLQFSEILKPFLSLALAAFISEQNVRSVSSFVKSMLFMLPVIILIAIQPDLGSGLLYLGAGFFALLVIGFPLIWFLALSVPFMLASPVIWTFLHGYQRQRILTFINKSSDPLGTSYNGIQAVIAVGSGAFLGKGITEGTQSVLKFLPERHTDFIFATIAEGFGFLGASLVILAFLAIAYRMYVLFRQSDDLFEKTFLSVSFGFFLIQGFVNIAMNMGILPIVGITFPFVSFGGSSLLSNFIFLGLISSFSYSNKNKHVLEIR